MSYNKLDYEKLTVGELLIEISDLTSCHNYTTDADFGEDEFFESEVIKMCMVALRKHHAEKLERLGKEYNAKLGLAIR